MAARDRQAAYEQVRNLLALDAANVMRRLGERHDEMVQIFGRLRDREALVAPLRSWTEGVRFADLAALPARAQAAVFAFYEQLDDLRWYLRYTSDMPSTLELRFSQLLRRLRLSHEQLVQVLGPPVGDTEDDLSTPPVTGVSTLPQPQGKQGTKKRAGRKPRASGRRAE